MRVLVLEDDVDLAEQIATMLRDEHYAVDVCHDGQEGHDLGQVRSTVHLMLDLLPRSRNASLWGLPVSV